MKRNNLLLVMVVINIFITAVLGGCNRKAVGKYEETQIKMDTVMTITAYGSGAKNAVQEAFNRIGEIESITSITINDSDVSKINNAAGKNYVKIHPEVLKIIKKSIEYSGLSNGSFDITVGPITKLWGIGTKGERIPSPQEIKEKMPLVGYDKIKINDDQGSVMLEKTGMIIDLGGIAKGYAADQAIDILKNRGIKKAIVNLGGSNIYVIGSKDEKTPWSIGLQHPRKEQGAGYLAVIKLSDMAMSTSGDYERYFIKDGKRYHHILNPATGYPSESGVIAASVTVSGSSLDNSMDADALSTAVFVLGAEKGMEFISHIPGVEYIAATSDNRLFVSTGLKSKIGSISGDYKYDAQGR